MLEIKCTGDYGLSDCLFVTQDAEDYVDAWFPDPGGAKGKPKPIMKEDR